MSLLTYRWGLKLPLNIGILTLLLLSLPRLPPFYCHGFHGGGGGEGLIYHHGYYVPITVASMLIEGMGPYLDYAPPGTSDSAWPKRTGDVAMKRSVLSSVPAGRCGYSGAGACWHQGGCGVRESSNAHFSNRYILCTRMYDCFQSSHTPWYHRNRSLLSLTHIWGIKGQTHEKP